MQRGERLEETMPDDADERLRSPNVWVVAPKGAIDIDSCGELSRSLDDVVAGGATVVMLDLGEVDFLDSSGLRIIVRAAQDLQTRGGRLLVENASGAAQRVLEVTGILEHLRADPID